MRVLGLDLGAKRIGVAVSDRTGTIASPLTVLQRSGSVARDHAAIARLVVEELRRVVPELAPVLRAEPAGGARPSASAGGDPLWAALERWAGIENFEERMVRPGVVDRLVLGILRDRAQIASDGALAPER